jgi:hypothetical protein
VKIERSSTKNTVMLILLRPTSSEQERQGRSRSREESLGAKRVEGPVQAIEVVDLEKGCGGGELVKAEMR